MNRNDAILTIIAVEVKDDKHGAFITAVARAWSVADPGNKTLIREAWRNVIDRYALQNVYSKEIEEHLPEYLGEAEVKLPEPGKSQEGNRWIYHGKYDAGRLLQWYKLVNLPSGTPIKITLESEEAPE